MPSTSPLQQRIERLYGLSCPVLADPGRLRALVSKQYPSDDVQFTFAERAGEQGGDPVRLALENNSYSPCYSELYGFLTNALLIGIPYRHEAIWLDLEPTQSLWTYAEGWQEWLTLGEGTSRFPELRQWAFFLFQLLPDYDSLKNKIDLLNDPDRRVDAAYKQWLSGLNAPSTMTIAEHWDAHRSAPGCADALICLMSAYFFGARSLLVDLSDELQAHPSEVVQGMRQLLHDAEWGPAADPIVAHLQRQRYAFLERISPTPVERKKSSYDAFIHRFPGVLPSRVVPHWAFRNLTETSLGLRGAYLCCNANSGLSLYEATAILEAPATPESSIAGLELDGKGIALPRLLAFIRTAAFEQIQYLSTETPLHSIAADLAASSHAVNLRWLGVRNADSAAMAQLGRGPYSLQALRVSQGGNVGVEGFQHLATARAYATLQELVLPNPHCRDEGIRTWLSSARTRHLRVLSIPNNYSGSSVDGAGDSLAELLASPLPQLTQLNLTDHRVGDSGARALAGNSNRVLRYLTLEGCGLSPEGVAELLASPVLSSLEFLSFHRTHVGALGAEALARSPHLEYLSWVRLGGIGDEGAAALAKANLPFLDSLDLERGHIGPSGVRALVAAPWLPSLQTLILTDNRADTESVLLLARSNRANRLSYLSVSTNPIGLEGVRALLDLPSLKVLKALFCGVPRSEFEQLQQVRTDVLLELA